MGSGIACISALAGHATTIIDREEQYAKKGVQKALEHAELLYQNGLTTSEALQNAHITLGVCRESAMTIPVEDSLEMDYRSVMGVELPLVRLTAREPELYYGLDLTNSQLDEAYALFDEVKRLLVELAETESSVYRLADAVNKTQKRTNALERVIVPRLRTTVRFITDALEEKDREDFSRLKVIKRRQENEE